MADKRATIIRGGRLINAGGHRAEAADILIVGDTIAEVGPPGLAAPADAIAIDARDRLMHPGLINAHMHGHGNLAKGMGDRWTLELLLAAGPWITGGRTLEDKYLSDLCRRDRDAAEGLHRLLRPHGRISAAERGRARSLRPRLRGCRHARRAGADGRGVQLLRGDSGPDRCAAAGAAEGGRAAAACARRRDARTRCASRCKSWKFDRASVRPAVAPTIPHHCSDDFMRKCAALAREFDVGLHSHVQESKAQVMVGLKRYGKTPDRASAGSRPARARLHGGARRLARP